MRQSSLIKGNTPHPYNTRMPSLSWGKIVHRNSDNTVDVALWNGSTFKNVQIGANTLGSQVGSVYVPTHGLTNPVQTSTGTWDTPIQSTKGDLYCVVGFLDGMSRQPKILGFFNPQQTEMSFSSLGISVSRHESGAYHVTLPGNDNSNNHDEQMWPDGSYFIVGETTPHDMTTENPNWSAKPKGDPAPVIFHHASGIDITINPSGAMTFSGPVTIENLTVGTGSGTVALANILGPWISSHTHTSSTAGSPTSPPNQSLPNISSSNLTAN